MYKVYPVIPVEPQCSDYSVKIDGSEVPLATARVSSAPFNRRWPGHQREISQTEAAQFLSLECDGPVTLEITPKEPFDKEKLRIRPHSLGVTPKITDDGRITLTLPHPAYFTVEPYGRNHALHVFADPVKDYSAAKDEAGVIYFGKGEHDVGVIEMHSGETLFIDEGAVVYASVYARDADNICIVGRGILDNSRNKEVILFEANEVANASAVRNAKRRHTVQLEYCKNVEINGITVRDSLVYNIRPIGCEHLRIRNVKIIGCWRYNSDGIDMHNCRDVRVSDCFLRTFDDAVCVKGFDFYDVPDMEKATHDATYHGGRVYDEFSDTVVERCVIWNDWGKGLEIGAETKAREIFDIRFTDCDLIHALSTPLDCFNIDYADVHDVTYENIRVELDESVPCPVIQNADSEEYVSPTSEYMPPLFRAEVSFHHEYSGGGTRRGKCRDITLKDIHVYSDVTPRIEFCGYDAEHGVDGVTLDGIYVNGRRLKSLDELCVEYINGFVKNVKLI